MDSAQFTKYLSKKNTKTYYLWQIIGETFGSFKEKPYFCQQKLKLL